MEAMRAREAALKAVQDGDTALATRILREARRAGQWAPRVQLVVLSWWWVIACRYTPLPDGSALVDDVTVIRGWRTGNGLGGIYDSTEEVTALDPEPPSHILEGHIGRVMDLDQDVWSQAIDAAHEGKPWRR